MLCKVADLEINVNTRIECPLALDQNAICSRPTQVLLAALLQTGRQTGEELSICMCDWRAAGREAKANERDCSRLCHHIICGNEQSNLLTYMHCVKALPCILFLSILAASLTSVPSLWHNPVPSGPVSVRSHARVKVEAG